MQETNKNTSSSNLADSSAEVTKGPLHLTATIGLFRSIIDYCRDAKIDIQPVLAAAGLTEARLEDIDDRIQWTDYMAGFEKASSLSVDPFFGLHFGEQIKPGHYGIMGMIAMSCSRAGELMELHRRYQALISDSVINRYETTAQGIRLTTQPLLPGYDRSRLHFESTFSSWITLARWITGLKDHFPLEVCFPFAAPDDLSEYHRVFGTNLLFEQPAASVLFDSALMDRPIPQSNPALRQQLEAQAQELLLRTGANHAEPMLQQVQQLIANSLADGTPDIEGVAEKLAISTRGLQRKLKEHDTSFSQILDSTRQELANSYISKPHISLTEIAFLLGFSEQSAFNRAFKRWTGSSPSGYRKTLD